MKKFSPLFLLLLLPFCFSCTIRSTPSRSVSNMTDQEIITKNSYTKSSSITRTVNKKTTVKVKHFSGIEKIATFQPNEQFMEVTLSCTLESGELRLVLCNEDEIIHEFDVNQKEQKFKLPADSCKYNLKTAGSDAKYEIEFSYEVEESQLPSYSGTLL